MAATLTHSGEQTYTYASFPIAKMETTADGDLYVYGKATDGIVDSDDQIVDPQWAAKALKDWFETGANVRVQHNPGRDPAGKGVEIYDDGQGGQWVKSLIVEPVAKELVRKGVLQAYSVGIMRPVIVPDQLARHGRITGGELGELSLVDRPANKGCRFELVKSFGGAPEFTGKMYGTDTLSKAFTSTQGYMASTDTVTVEIPKSARIKVTPADLAKMLGKRNFDPNVGGGVDRDKIPDEDFAGRDRSFPIVKPGDVSDAASSIGRAGSDNFSADQLKANIKRIAHRKGPAFVAELPDAWKDEATKTMSHTDEDKGKKKPFPGAAEPFDGKDSDGDGQDADAPEKDDEAKPEVTKGMKDCPECGKGYDGDAKKRRCENCGAKLPKINKGAGSSELFEQNDDLDDTDESSAGDSAGEFDDTDHYDDDDDKKPSKKAQRKALKKMAKKMARAMVEKGARKSGRNAGRTEPTPANGVFGQHAKPVDPHREPDGKAIEAFEADAKLPTDPDSQFKALMRVTTLGIPGDMAQLHDLLCPAYSVDAAHAAHPHASLKTIDVQAWRQKAFEAASGGTMEEALAAAKRLENVSTLTQTPDYLLDELHREDHAAFKALNPVEAHTMSPGTITPGQFRRPYQTSGTARPSGQHAGPNTGPGGFGEVMPQDFDRGYLSAGRADASPSGSGGTTAVPPPPRSGTLSPVQLTGALRANAQQAMRAMHDHVAQTFPDICPMHGPGDTSGTPVNHGIPAVGKSGGKSKKSKRTSQEFIGKAATVQNGVDDLSGVDMLIKSFGPDVIKGAVDEALAPVLERLAQTEAALKAQRKANKSLETQLDKMASLPDPFVAPFKGEAYDAVMKTSGSLVGSVDPTGVAARVQTMVQNELAMQARESTDPMQREAALNALYKMRGIG